MVSMVGRKVITEKYTFHDAGWKRLTITTDWWLHPTKGWRKGLRAKRVEPISRRAVYPHVVITKKWIGP